MRRFQPAGLVGGHVVFPSLSDTSIRSDEVAFSLSSVLLLLDVPISSATFADGGNPSPEFFIRHSAWRAIPACQLSTAKPEGRTRNKEGEGD